MAKPYKSGKTSWSVRVRSGGEDVLLSGHSSAKAASNAAAKHLRTVAEKGRPQRLGPHRTTLAQALSDYALERCSHMKGARQVVSRTNRYVRAAELPQLLLDKCGPGVPGLATKLDIAPTAVDQAPAVRRGRPARDAVKKLHHVVRLQTAQEHAADRRVVGSLKSHRAALAVRSANSDRLRARLANLVVAEITRADVQRLIDQMRKEGAQPGSLDQERALLRQLFNHAADVWAWSEPGRNPAAGLKMPALDNARTRVMSDEEEQRIERELPNVRNAQAVVVLRLLLETAMRCGEPLGPYATWGAVDWSRAVLHLADSKSGPRDVPLSPRAIELLTEVQGPVTRPGDERILTISYESLKAAWTRVCKRAEVYDLTLHDLRHTAATRFALRTGSIVLTKSLTGHKSLSQVERYVNTKADDVVKVMRSLTGSAPPQPMHGSVSMPAAAVDARNTLPVAHGAHVADVTHVADVAGVAHVAPVAKVAQVAQVAQVAVEVPGSRAALVSVPELVGDPCPASASASASVATSVSGPAPAQETAQVIYARFGQRRSAV